MQRCVGAAHLIVCVRNGANSQHTEATARAQRLPYSEARQSLVITFEETLSAVGRNECTWPDTSAGTIHLFWLTRTDYVSVVDCKIV